MSYKKWILKDAGESDIHYRLFMDDTENTEHVCEIWRTTDDKKTMENAKLATAAPDLLRALEICVKLLKASGFTSNDDEVAEAEDAIKIAVSGQ